MEGCIFCYDQMAQMWVFFDVFWIYQDDRIGWFSSCLSRWWNRKINHRHESRREFAKISHGKVAPCSSPGMVKRSSQRQLLSQGVHALEDEFWVQGEWPGSDADCCWMPRLLDSWHIQQFTSVYHASSVEIVMILGASWKPEKRFSENKRCCLSAPPAG